MSPFTTAMTHRRWAVMVTALIAVTITASACSSGDPQQLPGSDREVSSSDPITPAQAASVRNAGRSMALNYVRRLSATEADIDDARSLEEWENCTAAQKSFTFHPTQNGVVYTAVVYVDRPPLSDDEVKARFRDAPTEWKPGDDVDGTNGVFRVRADGQQQPFFFQVSSPCYYFGDVDGIPLDEQRKVTGFISREWDQ